MSITITEADVGREVVLRCGDPATITSVCGDVVGYAHLNTSRTCTTFGRWSCYEGTSSSLDIVAFAGSQIDESYDEVNRPSHYTAGGIECIDAIRAALTPEEFRGYCKGNMIKYIWRERHKQGDVSIEKAQWYSKALLGG